METARSMPVHGNARQMRGKVGKLLENSQFQIKRSNDMSVFQNTQINAAKQYV